MSKLLKYIFLKLSVKMGRKYRNRNVEYISRALVFEVFWGESTDTT